MSEFLKKISSLLKEGEEEGSAKDRVLARKIKAIIASDDQPEGRFSYSAVGYGGFSLLGEKYKVGRIEVFDALHDGGYQVEEGRYCVPHAGGREVEDFFDNFSCDLPLYISLGSMDICRKACADALGLGSPDDLSRRKIVDRDQWVGS